MPLVELFLSAIIQVLLDRLASQELLQFVTRRGIRSRLKKLEKNLNMINEVITHAENMLFPERRVAEWLEEIRDWAYDADDFLDGVNTKAMQEEEARRNSSSSSSISVSSCTLAIVTKVRDLGSGFISGRHSKDVDELNSRLDTISKRMGEMRRLMKMTAATGNTSTALPMKRPSEATADEFDARVFGREQEKERIIEQLKSGRGANVEVIPIVGMPGIGKTTLARHVFHSVQQQQPPLFDIKGFVWVSHDFDVYRITRDIIESFTSRPSNLSALIQLHSELMEVVRGKRFLLVLDDVWSRDYSNHWARLRAPFGVGAPGSKILVTTRDNAVASMMQRNPMKIHHLGTLCGDDCWSVFLQHVDDTRNSVFESEAGRFRMKILDKCKGLPLTARLLGGLLRRESPGQGWEAKLNSSIWDLSEHELSGGKGYGMLPVVMLSYFHLPPQLKRCFSYCSVLPKDYEFGEEEVVLLWMAQGFVFRERGEQVEVTGAKYFHELVSRSLFQPSPDNPSRFLMHDMINDMAEIVAGKSCFKFDGDRNIDNNLVQARYSSYRNFSGLKMEFEAFEKAKYLQAFQSFDHFKPYNLTSYVPLELLMKLKYLRVLCLSKYSVTELPEDIGDLIHLRLVDLSHTDITRLPESTSRLYNLLSLNLKGCSRLRSLPTQMRKLINLRNLNCSGPNKLEVMPAEMGKLISLQKLSNFIVGKGVEQGVGQLKYLSHLKGNISISFLENIHDNQEAREAKLMSKEGLRSLELKWRMDCDDGDLQGTVFEELQPHKHLEKLIINGYGGLSFPVWVGNDGFSKMRVIELANCEKCTTLPPLGKLPVLEEIQIRNMAGIERVGEEFYEKERGAFALLKILKFESMENWSIWWHPIGGGCHFACLQELHVINCPKLSMSLRDGINVQKLVVRECDKLLIALPRQSIFEMDIRECKLEFMECLKEDGDASPLLPSATSLNIEKVDVAEAVGSARMRMNTISNNNDALQAHHQMMKLRNLTALVMASIPKLTHLPGVVLQGLPKLETLRICRCAELTSLWKMDGREMEIGGLILQQGQKTHFLNSLRDLEVKECYQLDCLVPQRGEVISSSSSSSEEEDKRGKQQYLGLPCGLETLVLRKCGKLKKLPSDMHNLASLSQLVISDCDKLEKLPSDFHNLTSLHTLRIWNCRRLSSLPGMGFPSNLESLFILGCDLLTCLSSRRMPLPHSLKELNIWECKAMFGSGIPFSVLGKGF